MNFDNLLIILLLLVLASLGYVFYEIRRFAQSKDKDEVTKLLTQLLSDMRGSMDKTTDSMARQTKAINERLDRAAHVIAGVSKSVGEMTEVGRSMKDLQDFFRSPKLRGQVGEQILKDILGQMLPKQNFHLQYTFRSGDVVDAALKIEQGIIPIDAKFPMENFRKLTKATTDAERTEAKKMFIRDVKKHIDDIASKYIKPAENTLDFALMYIPSETIYYEILTNQPELEEYAYHRRVRPVSPNTLYAYIRAIIMSLEGQKIGRGAQAILAALREIGDDTQKFGETLSVLTRHIRNAAASSDDVNSRFARLSSKISTVQQIEASEEKLLPKQ